MEAETTFEKLITENKVTIFGATWCPWCTKAAQVFAANDLPYKYVELDITEGGDALMQVVQQKTGEETIPQIYINAKLIGGFDKLMQILQNGDFYEVYEPEKYAEAVDMFDTFVRSNKVMIFSGTYCPFCTKAKDWLDERGIEYYSVDVDVEPMGMEVATVAAKVSGMETIPNIFVNGQHLGGYDQLVEGDRFSALYEAS